MKCWKCGYQIAPGEGDGQGYTSNPVQYAHAKCREKEKDEKISTLEKKLEEARTENVRLGERISKQKELIKTTPAAALAAIAKGINAPMACGHGLDCWDDSVKGEEYCVWCALDTALAELKKTEKKSSEWAGAAGRFQAERDVLRSQLEQLKQKAELFESQMYKMAESMAFVQPAPVIQLDAEQTRVLIHMHDKGRVGRVAMALIEMELGHDGAMFSPVNETNALALAERLIAVADGK